MSRTSQVATVRPPISSPERDVIVTLSPAFDRRWAMARPMPRLPPVTRTDRPISRLPLLALWCACQCVRACKYRRVAPGRRLGVLESEADLHADLEMCDLAAVELAPDLGHLEPVQVPQRLGGSPQAVADGGVDALG